MNAPASKERTASYFYVLDKTVCEITIHEPDAGSRIPEALVHDVWGAMRFDTGALTTTTGESLVILDPGRHNTDAGPDFCRARLRIGGVEWVGDIEIHTRSGTWITHGHHRDLRYNSVVLHVTLHSDIWTGKLVREDESPIPEIVLYGHLEEPLRQLLHRFYTTRKNDILCGSQWKDAPATTLLPWLNTLARERLNRKAQSLSSSAAAEDLLHERIFAALGYAKNSEPMSELARRAPLSVARQLDDARDLEALYLGVAGFLPAPSELIDTDRVTADYAMNLRDRYTRLQSKHFIPALPREQWRFFRLRPANFPTIRIAQAIAMLAPDGFLRDKPVEALRRLLGADNAAERIEEKLCAEPSSFWNTHLRLDRVTSERNAALGAARRNIIITNAVAPVMLVDAERHGDDAQRECIFDLLRSLPAPADVILRRFRKLGTRASDAFQAQGIHQLYRTRCTQARCLECDIGRYLLGS